MEVAAEIANGMDLFKAGDAERHHAVLDSLGFNLEPPKVDMEKVMAAMHKDKKAVGGAINFVLPTGIGSTPVLRGLSDDLIADTMERMGYAVSRPAQPGSVRPPGCRRRHHSQGHGGSPTEAHRGGVPGTGSNRGQVRLHGVPGRSEGHQGFDGHPSHRHPQEEGSGGPLDDE